MGLVSAPAARPGAGVPGARVAAVVLAAGMSTRMGVLKQLLPLGGRTMVERAVEPLVGMAEPICVVVGHRAAEVAAALRGWPVECVYNQRFGEGMLTSVQSGICAAPGAVGYLVCLGDQPGLSRGLVEAVLRAAGEAGRGIVVPTFGGRRGHPVYFAARYRDEVLALGLERGLNVVTRGHPADTLELGVPDPQIVTDIDTPEDYAAFLRRTPGE